MKKSRHINAASADTGPIIVTGCGRSGTNWLLDIFNASPDTHCRNEPYGIRTSPFHSLPQAWKVKATAKVYAIGNVWDEVIKNSSIRMGERDHSIKSRKKHIHKMSQRIGLLELLAHKQSRKILGVVFPELRASEWLLPHWAGSREKLSIARAVFKVDFDARLVGWILDNRPAIRIVHIVRNPCGRMNSWINRHASQRDKENLARDRGVRLKNIAAVESNWAERFGDIESMSLIEMEAWFYRYVNESVYSVGKDKKGYTCLRYEELAENPVDTSKLLYEFCDIQWDPSITEIIVKGSGKSVWGTIDGKPKDVAIAWENQLAPDIVEQVNKIMADSPMRDWWSPSIV